MAETQEASADAPASEASLPGVDASSDAPADVVQDAAPAETSPPVDAGADAPTCAPVMFPLTMAGCAPIAGPGSTWLLQPQATPPACFSYALNEAGVACERCASTFTCACIDPDGGLTGVTCETSASGVPVLVQQ